MLKRSLKLLLGSTALGGTVGIGYYTYQNSLEQAEKVPEPPKIAPRKIPVPAKIEEPKKIEKAPKIKVEREQVKEVTAELTQFVVEKAKVHYKSLDDFLQ